MKTRSLINTMVCLAGLATVATAQAQNVVISAVYGGSSATSALSHDFVELRNRTGASIDISGWSLQYSSATGTSWNSQKVVFASGSTIPANGFFLIRLRNGSNSATPNVSFFDATANFDYSGTNGKLALLNTDASLPAEICPSNPAVVDKVAYGTGNCPEGTAAASPGAANVVVRLADGCTDTNNNSADFANVAGGSGVGEFFPRWSGSPAAAPCGSTIIDCNNNGIDDAIDIAGNPSLDCDTNGAIDSCQITGNPALDCNFNGVLDSCDIDANPSLDCNNDNQIDSCQIIANPILDCDGNTVLDSCQIAGTPSLDCNNNSLLDSCDIVFDPSLDLDTNGVIDTCELPLPTTIIISEVVDGSLSGGQPKFIEITNLSTTESFTFTSVDVVRNYNNGSTTPSTTFSLDGVVLLPGQSYVITTPNDPQPHPSFLLAYGGMIFPDAYSAVSGINGDDAVTIERNGVVVDAFGAVGTDGTGTAWEYTDSYARRKPGICTATGTFNANDWIFGGVDGLEQTLVNLTSNPEANGLYVSNLMHLTSPKSHANSCFGTLNDCNGNGIDDSLDIAGGTPDCNANGVPDSCDIVNGARDCNSNGIPDNCDILSGNFPDANTTGIPDVCDSFQSDCNGNFIEDAEEIANGAPDCNANGVLDVCEPLLAVDADANGTPDLCDGAYVAEADTNATVQPAGVRALANGLAFFNVEGVDLAENASYGGTRFDLTDLVAQFDTQFGAGNWHVERAYVRLVQSNAAFSATGDVSIQHTNNDTADFVPAAAVHAPLYADYATDYPDAQEALLYTYTVGTSGDVENRQVFDANGTNLPGGVAIAEEINSGNGPLTVLFREGTPTVAATYAGVSNFTYLGPTLVVFAAEGGTGGACNACPADYNLDGGVDGADLSAFFTDYEAGELECADTNQDGGIDGADLAAFFTAYEAGGC